MTQSNDAPRLYRVNAKDRAPLIEFMREALVSAGCTMIHVSPGNQAPFRISFETALGERMGIIVYAFLATFTLTKNRPEDEHSFQVKYGTRDGELHEIWQDPFCVYTTMFVGINPQQRFFVAVDPSLNNPTKFFIRVEFKQQHVDEILRKGWHAWERTRRTDGEPVQVLVGGRSDSFLRAIRFERAALGLDQGHRQLLAEQNVLPTLLVAPAELTGEPYTDRFHTLSRELELSETEVLDLIAQTRRLKMAVRGWVAEEHLVRFLKKVPGVAECSRSDAEGGPDVLLSFEGSRLITIECKNVLREKRKNFARVDLMRTRASKNDPCSRYYSPNDFDVVAACMHAVSERWEFQFVASSWLDPHKTCAGKLTNGVSIDERWTKPVTDVLRSVAKR